MEHLEKFFASSANFDKYPILTYKSVQSFSDNLNKLLEFVGYKQKIYDINEFIIKDNQEQRHKLSNLLNSYGSDKANGHNYDIIYSYIFNKLGENNNLNILEIGLGTNNPNLVSTMGYYGRPGASVRAFRDYLPNSNIYGADIDRDILFTEDRIKTFYVDQLDPNSFNNLTNKYNLIIDDGLHNIGANLNTLFFALNNIENNGWIVIEDISIGMKTYELWNTIDFILKSSSNLNTYLIKTNLAYIYVVNKIN